MKKKYNKILILGSGAIKIGQAGEFDYSGSQAIKALKEEGISTVLINPNIATVQTSESMADKIYFLPLDLYFIERVIEKEKPDGILLGFGGQTSLNAGIELWKKGILSKHNVEVLGTSVETIINTEDRDKFVNKMTEIGLKVPISQAVSSVDDAIKVADEINYPVMIRIAYALGGLGSGIVYSKEELIASSKKAFSYTDQILIEESLKGWKEVEYEVVRDRHDNCIVICTMENFDPMGIHTGESIVVAPVQTLTATEMFKLRSISIKAIRHLGVIGECNIQFAFDPKSDDYRIIEVNPRLSRSSALASKATGYPLAFIASKLSLGHAITEIRNIITEVTSACFEPALDYIVLKYPRWDLDKFTNVHPVLGTEMKSVGEVMAIGRSLEEVLQKAIRMLDIGANGLVANDFEEEVDIDNALENPTDRRIFAIAKAFQTGYTVQKVHDLTKIDKWFLFKMKKIVDTELELEKCNLDNISADLVKGAKQKGFSDIQISKIIKSSPDLVRVKRKELGIIPYVKQIDTLAAEYPAMTNYLYMTYNASSDDLDFTEEEQVVVLGSGAYRIGSSVEFDWCCVNANSTLKKIGYKTIMINYNPETVSTDYDLSDKLYFEELSLERVLDIFDKEEIKGVIVSMGGQIPNNLAISLSQAEINILGTTAEMIDNAEDRHKFSALLDSLDIDQPDWKELSSIESAREFAKNVGYPVIIRPSYVLSGAAMSIALNEIELEEYLLRASNVNNEHPVVISKFIANAKEIEIDAVANNGELYCYAISGHVENAGVHSGDATIVLPPQRTYLETMRRIKNITRKIALALKITGPFNIQFIAKNNEIKVIECNLRVSRSFPFVSKATKLNFIDKATRLMMGEKLKSVDKSSFDLDYVGVKASQFSYTRLKGSDPILKIEMNSTGEVACFGDNFHEAFLKSLISVGFKIPKKNILLSTGPIKSKVSLLESIKILKKMNYNLYATKGTAEFLKENNIDSEILHWPDMKEEPNTLSHISEGKIDLVINIPKNFDKEELDNDYQIRRKAIDFNIPLVTNVQLAKRIIESISLLKYEDLKIKSWDEYE